MDSDNNTTDGDTPVPLTYTAQQPLQTLPIGQKSTHNHSEPIRESVQASHGPTINASPATHGNTGPESKLVKNKKRKAYWAWGASGQPPNKKFAPFSTAETKAATRRDEEQTAKLQARADDERDKDEEEEFLVGKIVQNVKPTTPSDSCENLKYPVSLNHTEEACKKMKNAIRAAVTQGIETAKAKLKKGVITRTTFAIMASIERTVVTILGNVIEKVASVGERVQHVGNASKTNRKKVTDVLISLDGKVYRVEIKTSSNSKTGTDKAQMITNCKNNKETNIEGWWVIAFRKFGENPSMKCFKQDEQQRRLGTKHFWELCGIDYQKLLEVWHNKDFIIDKMIHESEILLL